MALAAETFQSQSKLYLAFEFYLSASRAHANAGINAKKSQKYSEDDVVDFLKYSKGNLDKAISAFDSLVSIDNNPEQFRESKEFIFKVFQEINHTDDIDLMNLCAELRTSIKRFIS